MYCSRTLETFWMAASEQFPVLLVTGARQVGRSTFLQHLAAPNRTTVTLDDPLVASLARSDPALWLQRYPPPLLIDEIQYAPQLLPYLKMHVDRERVPGAFWLTGSQPFPLMRGVSESLAGRVGVVQLLGLSQAERAGRGPTARQFLPTAEVLANATAAAEPLSLKELFRRMWRGSLPALALHDALDRDLYYGSYVQTYLQRDVRDLVRVGDELAFLRFLRATAARTAQLLNLAELARDVGIAVNTAKSWLSILQASGVVYLLEPYATNVTTRLVKTPKLFFLDTGLAAYLTEWSSPETLEAGAMSGPMLETWVVAELLKGYSHSGQRAPFYFYRDRDRREIDLLIVRDGTVYPLEIKKTATPSPRDVRHFEVIDRLGIPSGSGGLICLTGQWLPLTATVAAIPVALL